MKSSHVGLSIFKFIYLHTEARKKKTKKKQDRIKQTFSANLSPHQVS